LITLIIEIIIKSERIIELIVLEYFSSKRCSYLWENKDIITHKNVKPRIGIKYCGITLVIVADFIQATIRKAISKDNISSSI